MLELNPETVCFLIVKAREFQAKEAVVIPERPLSPSEDWALQILADHEDDQTFREFREAIRDLEPDQRAIIVALMWLGRGDYDLSEWAQAVAEAKYRQTRHTAEYLISKPQVADFLEEGLSLHGYSCEI